MSEFKTQAEKDAEQVKLKADAQAKSDGQKMNAASQAKSPPPGNAEQRGESAIAPPPAAVLGQDMGQALPLSKSDREHAKRLGVDSRAYAQMKASGQLGAR